MPCHDAPPATILVWKIENFIPENDEFYCPRPSRISRTWAVVITCERNNHIFVRLNLNCIKYKVDIYCSISFLDSNGTSLICKESVISPLQKYEDLEEAFKFPNEAKFFPNDTLIVECCVRRKFDNFPPGLHFVRERRDIIKKDFKCVIPDFKEPSALNENLRRSFKFSEIISGHNLEIEIFWGFFTDPVFVCLTTTLFGYSADIQVSVLDNAGEIIGFKKTKEEFVRSNWPREFDIKLTRNIFNMQHTDKIFSRALSFIFTCTFRAHEVIIWEVEEKDIFELTPPPITPATAVSKASEVEITSNELQKGQGNKPESALQALQEMLSEGYLSDFTFKVGDRTFPVHKSILGIRSKVFRSMFSSEMKEMQDNCVDIEDVDGDTFHRLLQFIYSDRIDEDMDWSAASSLYGAADFYALEPLKEFCRAILEENLSTTSALGVLAFADLHQDHHLKSAALDFIWLNESLIVGTENWVKFAEKNIKLSMKTQRELYSRKMNG